jgi:hypothetical protein
MNAKLKELLVFMLKSAAKDGLRTWPTLKAELVAAGLDERTLEAHHKEIGDLFLVCLSDGRMQDSSRYDLAPLRQSRSPPLKPHPPSPVVAPNPSVLSPSLFRRTTSCNTESDAIPNRAPEEGWIGLKENMHEPAYVRFSFGLNPENTIGTHIIDRYEKQLRPRIRNGAIDLVYCLESSLPGRTYAIKFQIEDSEKFDILLGIYWRGDRPKEVQSDNGGAARANRDSRGISGKLKLFVTFKSRQLIPCPWICRALSLHNRPTAMARSEIRIHFPNQCHPNIWQGFSRNLGPVLKTLDQNPVQEDGKTRKQVWIRTLGTADLE